MHNYRNFSSDRGKTGWSGTGRVDKQEDSPKRQCVQGWGLYTVTDAREWNADVAEYGWMKKKLHILYIRRGLSKNGQIYSSSYSCAYQSA